MGELSKRQVLLKYGFNSKTFSKMISRGLVSARVCGNRVFVDEASLFRLVEGDHYVVCQVCGAFRSAITPKHLSSCSGLSLIEYQMKFPHSAVQSVFCTENKAKTQEQRVHQSETLKRRFQSDAGQLTRAQISEAAKRLMQTPYRDRAIQHLKVLNADPNQKIRTAIRVRSMWADPVFRARIQRWQSENRESVLQRAASARSSIRRTFTSIHAKIKAGLMGNNIQTQTEYPIGYYHVDEAIPESKLAIEVDGCYWHGCVTCGFVGKPLMVSLDKRKATYLKTMGWTLLRVAEHDVKGDFDRCLADLVSDIRDLHGKCS